MRVLLDTNVLVFFLYDRDELRGDVKEVLFDYANALFTSTVCVHELIHLCQIGKIGKEGGHVLDDLSGAGVTVEPVTQRHLAALASLPLLDGHRDPADRLIIAQAMSDRTVLVSSDRQFPRYVKHGLRLLFNGR